MPGTEDRPGMTRGRRTFWILLVWAGVLAAMTLATLTRLEVSGDLRAFMPAARTADERLLLDVLGEGAASRLLLLALSGGSPPELTATSIALREALTGAPGFRGAANGEDAFESVPESLRIYRYLLSPTLDARALDAAYLREQLVLRVRDLASPAGSLLESIVPSDPTLESLSVAEKMQPAATPRTIDGVWFDRAGARALLLIELDASGVDPRAQRAAIAHLQRAFDEARAGRPIRMEVSGPAAFGVALETQTRSEASRLALVSSVAILLLLALSYRDWRPPLLGAVPLASAAVAGLAAVSVVFGAVHGITLAFGFTLIGIAQDYPVHLFSHAGVARTPTEDARRIWPTLATGAFSTCLAFGSFYLSGVDGLMQLATFAIAGLLAAAAVTRWLMPHLLQAPRRPVADFRWVMGLARAAAHLPRLRMPILVLAVIAVIAALASARPWWDDNLAALTPLPAEVLARDHALRAELGAPDVRYLLLIEQASVEGVLQRSEDLEAGLAGLVQRGALADYVLPSRTLPSIRTQTERQLRLPDAQTLARDLASALEGLPFRASVFSPFLRDVDQARGITPLTPAGLENTPFSGLVESLVRAEGGSATAMVSLTGVEDPAAVASFAKSAGPDVRLLDLRSAAESLASGYRGRMLAALLCAVVLLSIAVAIALRRPRRVARVLTPVLVALVLTVPGMHLAGIAFNLFHLIALVLGSGLGLDYALFFEHGAGSAELERRTLHAVAVSATSTLLVFGLLATSGIPVLRAIGLTVTIGVACNFLLAATFAAGTHPHGRIHALA